MKRSSGQECPAAGRRAPCLQVLWRWSTTMDVQGTLWSLRHQRNQNCWLPTKCSYIFAVDFVGLLLCVKL